MVNMDHLSICSSCFILYCLMTLAYLYVHTHSLIHSHVHAYTHMHAGTRACTLTRALLRRHTYTHTHTHTHTHTITIFLFCLQPFYCIPIVSLKCKTKQYEPLCPRSERTTSCLEGTVEEAGRSPEELCSCKASV